MNSEKASSSFPSPTSERKYDVFLSFRGKDTRKGFTNNLYKSLVDQGIKTFMDDPELRKGKSISQELFTAIEESNLAVIVLSPNYACSTWCLDELLKILECMEAEETILPVFYDVNPCDVGRQIGSFAEAFTKHEERLEDTKKVQRWRDALTKVSKFSGWNSQDWGYESELIKDIVGIDSRVELAISLLDEVVNYAYFIGIWGMGGIGKTTIAKVLFNQISHQFELSKFISNVRSKKEESGLVQLQKELISGMLGKEIDVWDVDEGATEIKRFVCGKKVLLVLDDVNHSDQLDYLAGTEDWFGSGSIIIITTRDEHLLVKHGVKIERRYKVQGLQNNEALQLFCQNAFRKDYPEQTYHDLTDLVVKYAKGLPLALKVLGSFLHGRSRSAWESALAKLRKICNAEIFETLKISYDGLDDDEKKIFLDIACFYRRYKKNRVIKYIEYCGFDATIGIEVLVERSLLTISADGTLQIHDLLHEMGVEIVRRESPDDPGKRSRVFRKNDIAHVLENQRGTEAVQGIALRVQSGDAGTDLHLDAKSLSMMTNLKTLILGGGTYNMHLSGGLEYLPSDLRILFWKKLLLQSLASLPNLENLRVLGMSHSEIEYLWEGKKPLKSLERIYLNDSLNLLKIPDLSGSPNLKYLVLQGCIRLDKVDSSVGFLENLTYMNLKGCKNLRLLPSSVSGLKSLKWLNLSGCSKLDKLPEDLGHLESLESLDVSGTALRELPSCMGLKTLKELLFSRCTGPPISMVLLSFAGLHSLTKLDFSDCNLSEGAIPNDLGCLSSLKELYLGGNQFVSLPESLSQLCRLEALYLQDCHNLQKLPKLSSHVELDASHCFSLKTMPQCTFLSVAFFYNCFKLVKHGCNSLAFTSMKRHLQVTLSVSLLIIWLHFVRQFQFIIPGNEIPEWFDHQTAASSVSINLPRGWFNMEFVGFAFCAVFAVHGFSFEDVRGQFNSTGTVKVNGKEFNCTTQQFNFEERLQAGTSSDHLWFQYNNSLSSYFRHAETTKLKQIEYSVRVSGQGLVVRKCGVRLVYRKDDKEANQYNANSCEKCWDFWSYNDIDDFIAATASDAGRGYKENLEIPSISCKSDMFFS